MNKDIVPALLEAILKDYDNGISESEVVARLWKELKDKKATYQTAQEFAIETGELLSEALGANLSADTLPDGKMYYNIANRLLNETLGINHELVSGYSEEVQGILNKQAGIGLKVQSAQLNQNRIKGLVERLVRADSYDDVAWLLGSPITNFSQSIVDDTIQANARFHKKTGLSPKIVRETTGKCCKWCSSLVGSYNYGSEPKDIYRRHRNCRCVVDYHPGNGKKQNAHSKQWSSPSKSGKIKERYRTSGKIQSGAQNYYRDKTKDALYSPEYIKREEHAYRTYDAIKNSNQSIEKRKIFSNIGNFKEMRDFTKSDVEIAFDHVFNDVHRLEDGLVLFAPSIETAESWSRLISGRDIQPHDLLMLRHERMEHDLMYGISKLSYDDAHRLVNEKYDYSSAAKKYEEGRKK